MAGAFLFISLMLPIAGNVYLLGALLGWWTFFGFHVEFREVDDWP